MEREISKKKKLNAASHEPMRFFITFIESFSIFILTYLLLFYCTNYLTLVIAKFYGAEGELHYYGIKWITSGNSLAWNKGSVITIFSSAPFVCLILAGLMYQIFLRLNRVHYLFRLSVVWMFLHGFVYFFGAYIAGVISRTGFWYASAFINISFVFEIIMAIACAAGSIMLSKPVIRLFLASAYLSQSRKSEMQKKFVLIQIVFPWFLGSLFVILIKLSRIELHEIILLSSYSLFLIFFFFFDKKPILIPDWMLVKKYIKKKTHRIYLIRYIL